MMEDLKHEDLKLIRSWILQSTLFLVFYIPVFFFIAGDWRWRNGWLYLLLLALFLTLHPVLLIPVNPQLLAERARGILTEETKKWDRVVAMVAGGVMPFASQLLGALDHRFNWSRLITGVHLIGFLLTAGGYAIFLWAMVSNAFFAEGVRIQTERGHIVCDTGPYRFVRHPGYVGSILSIIGTPLLLNSIWALVPAILGGMGFILRTIFEDRTLQLELHGYKEYAERVKSKLFPGLF